MKTERITIPGSSPFKSYLTQFVRSRCENRPSASEAESQACTETLQKSIAKPKRSLRDGLREAKTVLAELRQKRKTLLASAVASRQKGRQIILKEGIRFANAI